VATRPHSQITIRPSITHKAQTSPAQPVNIANEVSKHREQSEQTSPAQPVNIASNNEQIS
ncbi:MAG: hypothetical protein KDI38_22770, partial [Calditrichaeota bacterium]|nr:hypothetical protein [Calditrichota bacterium]